MTAEGIEIIEVRSRKELDNFIRLPYSLYSNDPFFIPPLSSEMHDHFSDKNPFFLHANVRYFIARRNNKNAGRIVAIVNRRHIEFHKERAGFFGFFESENDEAVASGLLDKVSSVLKTEGMDIMRGPMNFSTNEQCGFLLEGFDSPPLLMTPYNPFYYNNLMERCGMKKAKDLYAYILDIPQELPEKILKASLIAEKKGIRVRPINTKKFQDEMYIFKDVYNSAWEKNWGFIPLTDEELIYLGKSLKRIVVPELTLIAEKDTEPVGFMGLLPDYNYVLKYMKGKTNPLSILNAFYHSKKIKDLRLLLLGIKSEYRFRGVDALLFREGFKGVKKGHYKRVEFSWILEDNIPVQRLVEMIGASLYKKYRIYEKHL